MEVVDRSVKDEKLTFLKILNLGIAQIILWGASYFLLSVLSKHIMNEQGWTYQMVYGCLSFALVVSGMLLPKIGSMIQRTNRYSVLLHSGFVMAIGLVVVGSSVNFLMFALGWMVIGIAMAMGLYDALFAAIGKKYGSNATKYIVWITLISSLAPSISWLFTRYILDCFGWRNTCYIYAVVLLITIFPIHRNVFKNKDSENIALKEESLHGSAEVFRSKLYRLLSLNFTLGSMITTAIIIHLIDILLNSKIEMSTVLTIIAFLGPSQSIARVIELMIGKRTAIEMSFISTGSIFLGTLLIFLSEKTAIPGVILFGIGNGMRSVLRGTLPLSVFGKDCYALIMGRLGSMPLVAQALAPFLGGLLIQQFGMISFFGLVGALAIVNIFLVVLIKQTIGQYQIISINK